MYLLDCAIEFRPASERLPVLLFYTKVMYVGKIGTWDAYNRNILLVPT